MAQAAGTYDTYGMVGIREDLENIIANVSPEEKPFQTMIGTKSVKNTYHEWQTDTLRATNTSNKKVQGYVYTYADPTPTVRPGNYSQIMDESIMVTETANAVDTAGRDTELAYQVAKKGKELALDREAILMNNQASIAGNSTVAPQMGGFAAWLETNARRGTGGADGGFNTGTNIVDAATDATAGNVRTFTETILKDLLQDIVTNARSIPKWLFMSPFQKRKFSEFTGISNQRHMNPSGSGNKSGQQKIMAGADVYESDFGKMTVVMDLFQRSREVFAVNPEYVTRGVLRPMKVVTPAKTSDAERRVLRCEETLIVQNEKAHGVIADLTTS